MSDKTKVLEAIMWLKSATPMPYLGPKFIESIDAITDYVNESSKEYENLYFDHADKCQYINQLAARNDKLDTTLTDLFNLIVDSVHRETLLKWAQEMAKNNIIMAMNPM